MAKSPSATTRTAPTASATGATRCVPGDRICQAHTSRSWEQPWPALIPRATAGAGGRTVAQWLTERLGRRVGRQLGRRYLRRLSARWLKPRPRHVQADPQAQAEFRARLRPLLRQVATAFPGATVELWAVDEHRIGLKPILHKVWTLPGQRPLGPVEHRYNWRYLVGFVHPASGRTVAQWLTERLGRR
ncbi:MAG TPA: winged helix-turn-helix domain-containing protein, partial [Ktedonobacterales bacterium]|nr:winged helix-turn-helix domain-containing protein [Ktedonobacterales bacterium]